MRSKTTALLMGYGIQGKGALHDLLKFGHFDEIRILDKNPELASLISSLPAGTTRLTPLNADVLDTPAIREAMAGTDIVICLLPRDHVLPMAEMAIDHGAHYACASYLDSFSLDEKERAVRKKRLKALDDLAKKKDLTVLFECGLDPGLDLLLAGESVRRFDQVEELRSYGAGFPERSAACNPLQYKFTWLVEGVLRSYFRPSRIIADGQIVSIPPEKIFFEENIHKLPIDQLGGTLDCFPNGDSIPVAEALGVFGTVKYFGRYVCRWEGHCAFWRIIAGSGFLRDEPVFLNDQVVDPITYLASLLSSEPQFFYHKDEKDITLTRIDITGTVAGKRKRELFQIIDQRDLDSGLFSMTRTVGFFLSIGVQMILDQGISIRGLVNPIQMPYEKVVQELAQRNINVEHWTEGLD